MKLTPDIIVATGLVVALVLSIVLGGDVTLQTNIAAGLTGFIGRSVVDKPTNGANRVIDGVTDKGVETK